MNNYNVREYYALIELQGVQGVAQLIDAAYFNNEAFFILEFCDFGNLNEYRLKKPNHMMNPVECRYVMQAVVKGYY